MKKYLYNPQNGAPIKNWYDGSNFWNLEVDECAIFPERAGLMLKETYGFLQELSPEEFERKFKTLEKEEISTVKSNADGKFVPKDEDELKEDNKKLDNKKKESKRVKKKVDEAKDAEPAHPKYWEMDRGAIINELNSREIEIRGFGKKGVYISKDQLIQLLDNDDLNK